MTRYRHAREQRTADYPRGIRQPFGAAARPAPPKPEPVPVTGDLVACPVCGGGVRRVKATYSLAEAGIKQGMTRLLGNHAYGGHALRRSFTKNTYAPCGGSGLIAEDQS